MRRPRLPVPDPTDEYWGIPLTPSERSELMNEIRALRNQVSDLASLAREYAAKAKEAATLKERVDNLELALLMHATLNPECEVCSIEEES